MSKAALFWGTAVVSIALDQLTKWYVRSTMPVFTSIPVVDGLFHLTHVENPGGAFSFLAAAPESVRRPFFLVVSVVAMFALVWMLRQVEEHQRLLTFALGGVLGGAVGNFIDRAWNGVVTDFLDVQWRGAHWPAFNVADSFISVGIVVLLGFSLFAREPEESEGNRRS